MPTTNAERRRKYYAKHKEKHLAAGRAYRQTPRGRYATQKTSAKQRGIEFELSFDEWWTLWEPHWEDRKGTSGKIMCRINEPGPYSPDNVYIGSQSDNMYDFHRAKRTENVYE